MKNRIGLGFLVATLVTALVVPTVAMAVGPFGGIKGGSGSMTQTKSMDQTRTRQRLQDGSCLNSPCPSSGSLFKKGNSYGPGDGTGNMGVGPKDGTGYGAPATRN